MGKSDHALPSVDDCHWYVIPFPVPPDARPSFTMGPAIFPGQILVVVAWMLPGSIWPVTLMLTVDVVSLHTKELTIRRYCVAAVMAGAVVKGPSPVNPEIVVHVPLDESTCQV